MFMYEKIAGLANVVLGPKIGIENVAYALEIIRNMYNFMSASLNELSAHEKETRQRNKEDIEREMQKYNIHQLKEDFNLGKIIPEISEKRLNSIWSDYKYPKRTDWMLSYFYETSSKESVGLIKSTANDKYPEFDEKKINITRGFAILNYMLHVDLGLGFRKFLWEKPYMIDVELFKSYRRNELTDLRCSLEDGSNDGGYRTPSFSSNAD
jgi:hypothetical protein